MMTGKFVAYYRVSTTKQGINGLGMDAQRDAVAKYLNGGDWKLIAEFAEVESGKRNNRQEMEKAIALCRKEGATLLIAKLDRLARNAAFLLNLRDSGVDFIATDLPHADRFTVGIMALVAEKERDMISQRTRDGLAAAKRRGIKLGNPRPAQAQTDLPPFANERSSRIWLRKSLYSRPLRGLDSRRALAFPRDNRGGFNLGSAANTSVCAAG